MTQGKEGLIFEIDVTLQNLVLDAIIIHGNRFQK